MGEVASVADADVAVDVACVALPPNPGDVPPPPVVSPPLRLREFECIDAAATALPSTHVPPTTLLWLPLD